ncbi:uncharacterized protein LOC134178612 [Corticium candelabrum]|uniref:uncharacterized protein LOC134178612 n=1 Tax=Corticium candelabrum TaxID=121492 RepID=UPI002E26D334|nr:uncharacterized protein LOC134178612 [Corticium candelabrum]XP_062501475.1 uncharacterized protein LOC134178612 [Corticium candelabrum]
MFWRGVTFVCERAFLFSSRVQPKPTHLRLLSEATAKQSQSTSNYDQHTESVTDPFKGIAAEPFSREIIQVLESSLKTDDIEIKPDGLIYLPEIKYRRVLNAAFGPGGWALMPRGESLQFQGEGDAGHLVTREYALFCHGRFVSQATGEHNYYPTRGGMTFGKACESAKSNALMRCCKDLGIASDLWDPQFVAKWKAANAAEVWCENVRTKERRKLWRRKDSDDVFPYPWKSV